MEALTLLRLAPEPRPAFCTADRLAFHGLCHLGFQELALSLEALLKRMGLIPKGGLSLQYSQKLFERWIRAGSIEAIQEMPANPARTRREQE